MYQELCRIDSRSDELAETIDLAAFIRARDHRETISHQGAVVYDFHGDE